MYFCYAFRAVLRSNAYLALHRYACIEAITTIGGSHVWLWRRVRFKVAWRGGQLFHACYIFQGQVFSRSAPIQMIRATNKAIKPIHLLILSWHSFGTKGTVHFRSQLPRMLELLSYTSKPSLTASSSVSPLYHQDWRYGLWTVQGIATARPNSSAATKGQAYRAREASTLTCLRGCRHDQHEAWLEWKGSASAKGDGQAMRVAGLSHLKNA